MNIWLKLIGNSERKKETKLYPWASQCFSIDFLLLLTNWRTTFFPAPPDRGSCQSRSASSSCWVTDCWSLTLGGGHSEGFLHRSCFLGKIHTHLIQVVISGAPMPETQSLGNSLRSQTLLYTLNRAYGAFNAGILNMLVNIWRCGVIWGESVICADLRALRFFWSGSSVQWTWNKIGSLVLNRWHCGRRYRNWILNYSVQGRCEFLW